VVLECQSQGAKPPAEIQWRDGEGKRIEGQVTEHVMRMEDRKIFKTISVLKFTPKNPISVKCTVTNDAFPEIKESETLQIIFKGDIQVEVLTVSEGDSFQLECKDTSDPDTGYKWFVNDNEVAGENSKFLKIEHFVAAYDKSVIKCLAQDGKGKFQHLKSVKLKLNSSQKKPTEMKQQMPLTNIQVKKKIANQKIRSNKKLNMKKTIFTCIGENDTSVQPTYVWMKGKLDKKVEAEDENHSKFNCKMVPNGYNKLNQMKNNMKDISRIFKKFGRTFNQIVTTMDSL